MTCSSTDIKTSSVVAMTTVTPVTIPTPIESSDTINSGGLWAVGGIIVGVVSGVLVTVVVWVLVVVVRKYRNKKVDNTIKYHNR